MAKIVDLNVRVNTALGGDDSLKTLRELKQVQKELVAGSEEYKKVSQRMADIKDKTKGATLQSQDLIDSLASAPGPLGMLGRGLDTITSSTNKFGLALKATGIGLVVSLIGMLVKAFSENEKAMKKLEPIMIQFEQILGGIFTALEPVFDMFVNLAIKAMPLFTTGLKFIYTSISTLLQSLGKLGSALYKVFSGDFKGAWEDAKSSVTGFGDTFNKTAEAFDKGASEMTKTEKKNAEEQEKIRKEKAEKAAKAAAEALTLRKADLEAKIKLETDAENTSKEKLMALYEERFQAEIKGQKMTDAQKQVLRAENAKKVEEALKADKDARQKAFDDDLKKLQEAGKLQIDQLTANYNEAKAIYGENSKEARAAQDAVFVAQSQALQNEKDILSQKKELTDAEVLRLKNIAIEQQNLTTTVQTENQKRIDSDVASFLKKQEEQKKSDDAAFTQKMQAATNDFDAQQGILDAKIEQDRLYYENLLAQENLTAEQRKLIQDSQTANAEANAQAQITIEQKKFEAQQALLNATGAAVMAVADIIGKNTVAGKALAVAASLINTYTAIAGQLAAFSKVPVPGYAIVQAVATGLIGFKAVKDIIATPVPTAGGGTGGASGAAQGGGGAVVPKPRGLARGGFVSGPGSGTSDSIPALLSNGESVINASSTAMFKPLLSTINSIGGGRRFASGGIVTSDFNSSQAMTDLANSLGGMNGSEPVKTYVVARDISNQQMMDREIKSRSTI